MFCQWMVSVFIIKCQWSSKFKSNVRKIENVWICMMFVFVTCVPIHVVATVIWWFSWDFHGVLSFDETHYSASLDILYWIFDKSTTKSYRLKRKFWSQIYHVNDYFYPHNSFHIPNKLNPLEPFLILEKRKNYLQCVALRFHRRLNAPALALAYNRANQIDAWWKNLMFNTLVALNCWKNQMFFLELWIPSNRFNVIPNERECNTYTSRKMENWLSFVFIEIDSLKVQSHEKKNNNMCVRIRHQLHVNDAKFKLC